jgi:hypothetical protein
MALGRFILHRFNGVEEFPLGDSTILASRTEDGIRIDLDAETEGEAIRTVADTADHPTNPRADVAFVVESLDAPRLVGQTFIVPHGRTKDDDLASLYYYEHDDLNDNSVEFLDRKHNMFLVRWTGTARDVNFYDGSKPSTTLEVEGWFRFEEFQKWSLPY